MTVRQNLLAALADRAVEAPRLDDVVEVLGLGCSSSQWSFGESVNSGHRARIVRKPDALLMDEPLAA